MMLMAAFVVTLTPVSRAFAEEAPAAVPQLIASFDKESYAAGERATLSFRTLNETPVTWLNVRVATQLPQSVKLAAAGGASEVTVARVAPGEAVELRMNVVFDKAYIGGKLVSTGDSLPPAAIVSAVIVVAVVAVIAFGMVSRNRFRRNAANMSVSLLVCVALVVGLAPALPAEARAEEPVVAVNPTAEEMLVVESVASCASPSISVSAKLTIGSVEVDDARATVSVADNRPVSANAQYTLIDLVSDIPFASNLSSDAVTLGGAFEGLSLVSVERTGATSATVRIDGPLGDAGTSGYVAFAPGAFENARMAGGVSVALETPLVMFGVEEGSYDSGSSTFILPISVKGGVFSDDAAASCFTFSDAGLTSMQFDRDTVDVSRGVLRVTATHESPSAQFEALSEALAADAGGVFLDPVALVGEPQVSFSHDMVVGVSDSLADAVYAVPYGSVNVESVQHGSDGSAQVSVRASLGVLDGSLQLADPAQISLSTEVSTEEGIQSGILEKSNYVVTSCDNAGFTFELSMPATEDGQNDWLTTYEKLSQDGDSEELFRTSLTSILASTRVALTDGSVMNAYGIAQQDISFNLTGNPEALSLSAESDASNSKIAFETLEFIANAIGGFAQKKEGISNGLGSIFGLIASFINTTPEYTLTDIYDELKSMEGQLTNMENSIDRMANELQSVDKRAGFVANWYQVKGHMDRLNSYEDMNIMLMDMVDKSDQGAGFKELTAENQELLTFFAEGVEDMQSAMGSTVVGDTEGLGNLILGLGEDTIAEYNNWIETYYNWDPETFDAKYLYLSSLLTAYVQGYSASMAYLNTKAAQSTNPFNPHAMKIKKLKKSAEQVILKLAGTVVVDETNTPHLTEKSTYRKAAEALPNGQYRCLVNNHVYGKDMLNPTIFDATPLDFGRSVERGDIHLYEFNGSLNQASWETMQGNLGHVRNVENFEGATTLMEELKLVGFSECIKWGVSERGSVSNHDQAQTVRNYDRYPSSYIAVSNASYNKLKDQTGAEHDRNTTLNVFDLTTGTVRYGLEVSWHHEVYLTSPPWWGYRHRLYPVRVV